MIDSHCHLTYPELGSQIPAVLQRAAAAGVRECVTIATDMDDARKALDLSAQFPNVHVVCGIHPHQAGKVEAGWDAALTALVRREDVHAVGEMGLDYHYDFSDRESQQRVFARQLEIAAEVKKPVVIHCREAHTDVLNSLAGCQGIPNVVFHCFTGSESEANEILERGYWISLTGVVTFKRSGELRRVAAMIPEDRLMIETDSPYLSPEPVRNARPNEPSYLPHTARCIAAARGINLETLITITEANTRRFYHLPVPQ
ncbi:MAG TPA: TatD family hydrolase [Phycisphaerae bacterium]|nr:TatD family hydrolase [Phycisphaerae bacterium]